MRNFLRAARNVQVGRGSTTARGVAVQRGIARARRSRAAATSGS